MERSSRPGGRSGRLFDTVMWARSKVLARLNRRRLHTVWRRDYPRLDEDVIRDFQANYGWVMPISLLALLDALARTLRPAVVLEIGSGLSTRVLQGALAGTGALLVSVDDDPAWLPPADPESVRMLGVTPDRPDVIGPRSIPTSVSTWWSSTARLSEPASTRIGSRSTRNSPLPRRLGDRRH